VLDEPDNPGAKPKVPEKPDLLLLDGAYDLARALDLVEAYHADLVARCDGVQKEIWNAVHRLRLYVTRDDLVKSLLPTCGDQRRDDRGSRLPSSRYPANVRCCHRLSTTVAGIPRLSGAGDGFTK